MIFNVVMGVIMLFKVIIGAPFYNKRFIKDIRCYFINRYLFNLLIICPAMILLRYFTRTYLENYFLVGAILLIFEILIGLFYIRYLYIRMPIENMDDIPGIKITEERYGIKHGPNIKKRRYRT